MFWFRRDLSSSTFFHCIITFLTVVLVVGTLNAQDGSTSMRGVVVDISGARIPAALVIVTSPETGFQRAAFTIVNS